MSERRLVLINNVYSHRNAGDSAIVEAIASYLRGVDPGCDVVLLSQFHEENRDYYRGLGYDSAPPLWDVPMDHNKPRRLARAAGSLSRLPLGPTARLYRRARLLVDAGGGSLFSSNRYRLYLGLYQHLLNLGAGPLLFGLATVAAPQSVGPLFRAADRRAVAHTLRRIQGVMVREPISAALLRKLSVPFDEVPDAAFLANYLRPPSAAARRALERRVEGHPNLGVTVLDWRWAARDRQRADARFEAYLGAVARAAAAVALPRQCRIHVFPHVRAGFGDSDADPSARLAAALGELGADAVLHEAGGLDASDLCQLYGAMDAFVGSRMHSCIFALLGGVPTVGLAYQPKTRGVFRWLGLESWVFEVDRIPEGSLRRRLARALDDDGPLRRQVKEACAAARQQVEQGFDRLLRPHLTP